MSETSLRDRVGTVADPAPPAHPDIAEWRAPTEADIDAMHGVFVAADRVDHPSWTTPREDVAETFELSHVDHARDTIVGFTADGTAVALGSSFRHPSTDERVQVNLHGAVHPQWRGRGIGAAVFGWQHARAEQQLAAQETTLPGVVHLYAGEHNDALAGIGERFGYRTERWFSTMVRDLTAPTAALTAAPTAAPIAVPDVPAGIELVSYSADRADDAREARNDAFRDHWGSLPSPPDRWAQFVGGPFLRPDLCTLALDDGRIVAFCLASVNEDDWEVLGPNAYIDLIGVVRSHRGRGLAPLVIAHTMTAIAAAGLGKAVLDVDTESPTGANRLYGSLGFAATERDRVLVRHY